MTKIILTFPVYRSARLSCVWYETGNSARPLACRWVPSVEVSNEVQSATAADPHVCRFCA
jgi:hypothetical protein